VQGNHYFDESEKVAFPAATLGFTGFPIIRIYRFPHHPDLPVSPSSGFTGFPIIRIYQFPYHPDLPVSPSSGFTVFPIIRIYQFPYHPDLPVSPSSGFTGFPIIRIYRFPHRPDFPFFIYFCNILLRNKPRSAKAGKKVFFAGKPGAKRIY
jgi:hypothetical protein